MTRNGRLRFGNIPSAHVPKDRFYLRGLDTPGPEVIKLFSCSTQMSMKFVVLTNLKLLSVANSFLLHINEHENFSANKYENANYCWHFHIY